MESGRVERLIDINHAAMTGIHSETTCAPHPAKARIAFWFSGKKGFLKELLLRSIKLTSLAVTILMFLFIAQQFYIETTVIQGFRTLLIIGIFYATLALCFSRTYNSYLVGTCRISELIYSQGLTNLLSAGIVYVLMCSLSLHLLNPLPLLAMLCVQTIWSIVWCYYANKVFTALYPPMRTAIIYKNDDDLRKLQQIKYFTTKFDVQKCIRDTEEPGNLYREVQGHAAIFMVGIDTELRNSITELGIKHNIKVYLTPQVGDVILSGAQHMEMFSIPIYRIRSASPTPEYALFKRGFDMLASILGIIVASPILLITALSIKLYDGGPVLYKQTRLTRNGRRFKIWKFRSMCVDAEKDGVARMACENDNRITPVGRIIRASRIDELPQLFNILVGQMSIVGPRPERPEIAAQYEQQIPAFSLRLQVKAGLTGCAQVYGRYNTEPLEKLQMDLMYINSMSLLEDLRLIFATLKILFIKDSTQGVSAEQITAAQEKR